MNLVIKEIDNKEIWESFLLGRPEKTFLHSWNWGEFQKKENNKIWRLGVFSNGELISVALVIRIKAKRGTFLFAPHGPIVKLKVKSEKLKVLEELLRKLKEIAKEEEASFIRIASIWERNEENIMLFKKFGFREAPIHMHPEVTWQLDIASSEEDLLMGMRKTTRYLIRQAQKNKDIEIIQSKDIEDLKIFNEIYQKTASRHKFIPFSPNYLKNQFSSFLPDDRILIFLGKYKGEVVSSAIVVFWQNIGFYHHGASLSKYRKIPVSYLLQWEAIKEAKNRGCQTYNFWGIAPEIKDKPGLAKSKHPWAGLTLFKMGFGGSRKDYIKTQDLPLSKKYLLTFIFEKMRKAQRGF